MAAVKKSVSAEDAEEEEGEAEGLLPPPPPLPSLDEDELERGDSGLLSPRSAPGSLLTASLLPLLLELPALLPALSPSLLRLFRGVEEEEGPSSNRPRLLTSREALEVVEFLDLFSST